MATESTKYVLQFDADTKKLLQGLQQVEKESTQVEKKLKSVKSVAKDAFSGFGFADVAQIAAGAKILTSSVNAYARLINVQATAEQVFGDSFGKISEFAKQAADDIGLSERAAIELTTKIAGLGKAAGISGDNLVGFSTSLTRLGADLGAAFNTSTTRAVEAMISAMSGSSIEPLREYNIVLSDTILKTELLEITGQKVSGTMTQQQRTLATYSKLIKASGDYIGQFDRESDQLLGTQQRLAAEWENLSASIGETFAPAAQGALNTTLDLVRGFEKLNDATGGIAAGIVGFGAAMLALRPLTQRITAFNVGLAESGRGGTVLGKVAGNANLAIGLLTAALTVNSIAAAHAAEGNQKASVAIRDLAAAGDDSAKQFAANTKIIEGAAQSSAGAWESFKKVFLTPWKGPEDAVDSMMGIFEFFKDSKNLEPGDETINWFKELANTAPEAAFQILKVAEANKEVNDEWTRRGLGINLMRELVNQGIITAHQAALGEEELRAAYEATKDELGVGEDAVRDYNAALTEDIDAIKERIATEEKLAELWLKLSEARPQKIAEAFGEAFGADTGLDTLANLRGINEQIAGLADLKGKIPTIAEMLDPENELAGPFLDFMQELQDNFGPQLQSALETGGAGAMLQVGKRLRDQLTAALTEGGFDPAAIQQMLEQLGLTDAQLRADYELNVTASVSDEAKELLDLARGEGIVSFEDFLKLRAAIEVDPEAAKNAIEAKIGDAGIELPAEVAEEVDYAAAAKFLEEQKVSFKAEGKIDAAKEKKKIEQDLTKLGPVKVPMEGKVDLTKAKSDVSTFVNQPRTIVIGVSSAARSGGGSNPGGGGSTPGVGLPSAPVTPVTQNIRTYITIPSADPSAMTRAATRWSRLNGQPTPQITRGR